MPAHARLLLACAWALAPARWPAALLAAAEKIHPPCRKSPELHGLIWPGGARRLVAFGGKGFDWKKKKHKKGKGGKGGKGLSLLEEAGEVGAAPLPGSEEEQAELALHPGSSSADREVDEDALEVWEEPQAEIPQEPKWWEFGGVFYKKKVRFFGDTWAIHVASGNWTEVVPPDSDEAQPIPRWKPGSTTFRNHSGFILFGGCKSTEAKGVMNDLWVFQPTGEHPLRARWTQVFTANPPAPRRGHIIVANKTHMVVAGGKGWTKGGGTQVFTDLWALPLSHLAHEEAASAAASRERPGRRGEARSLDQSLALKKPAVAPILWTAGTGFPGPPRWGATGTVLLDFQGREVMAFFGGRALNGQATVHSTRSGAYTYYNDLWLYVFETDSWILMEPRGGIAPVPRDHHGATTVDGSLYIFGGRLQELAVKDAVLNDLWSYNMTSGYWTQHAVNATVRPTERFMPGVSETYYEGQNVLAIFGGETLPGTTKRTSLNDVWVFAPNAVTGEYEWLEIRETDCSPVIDTEDAQPLLVETLVEEASAHPGSALAPLAGMAAGAALCALVVWRGRRGREHRKGAGTRPPAEAAAPAAQAEGSGAGYVRLAD